MGSSTHTSYPSFTGGPITEGPRVSKFTESVADNGSMTISSHDYECAFDMEGGDCEHITIDGIDPTFPDTWDLMPMTLSSSSAVWSSHSDDDDEGWEGDGDEDEDEDEDEGLGWGDSTLQIDGEEARHADAMARFDTRPRSRKRSWGGVLVLVDALRRRMKALERRMRRGRDLRGGHGDVVC